MNIKDGELIGDDRTRWEIAKNALLRLLETFSISDYINLVEFSSEVKALVPDTMLLATIDNIAELKNEINVIEPSGGTDFRLGMEMAFNLLIKAATDSQNGEEFSSSNCQKVGSVLHLWHDQDNRPERLTSSGNSICCISDLSNAGHHLVYLEYLDWGSPESLFGYSWENAL